MEEVFGFIESIVFAGDGFTVAKLKEPRKADFTCIVGAMPTLQPGESVRCKGTWKRHAQYGLQFEVAAFESHEPSDLVGIQKYLESGMIKGIGPVYAARIIKKFGLDTLKVIDEDPKRLLKVEGIGKQRAEKIEACWQEQKSIRSVMVFLRKHGVSPAYAQKIFRAYGDQSIEKVKSDPFVLARDIHGIGFKTADGIAKGMGMPPDAPVRIDAGIEHILWELSGEGNTCFPSAEIAPKVEQALEVPLGLVEKRLEALVKEGVLERKEDLVWLKALYLGEMGIARELSRLRDAACAIRAVDTPKALAWVEAQLKIELAPEQKTAVQAAVQKKVHIITGGPGTGKSTITRAILAITEKLTGKIVLAAPTGRAAKRMSEITGKKASTIHCLLEFQGTGFKKNRENPLDAALVIIDEASMIDTQLMYTLLKAIPSTARLILIGDIDQLPSVGPGNVLGDIIASETVGVTRLKQIFRQAAGSRIVTNAHRINAGEFPDISRHPKSDFIFIEKESPEEIVDCIVDLVAEKLPRSFRFHRFEDIQVLSPMKRGAAGSENMNAVLQQKLNPSPTPLCRMGRSFHVGDKVMQVRNNYQKFVFNGDVGKITAIDLSEQTVTVSFEGKLVGYDFSEIDELVLAYAVSIHKYQGSECPCVIIPMHTSHFKLLHRNLLYTGVTRGKKLVVLVGMAKAVAIAVNNNEVQKRHTGLAEACKKFNTGLI